MFFFIRTESRHGGGLPAYFAANAQVLHIQYNPGTKQANGTDEATARIGNRFGIARAISPNRLVVGAGRGGFCRTHNLHLRYVQVRRKKNP